MTDSATLTSLLAVSHEASLTGAPMNLLHFIRWVSQNTDCSVSSLILKDGPLSTEFARVGHATVFGRSRIGKNMRMLEQGLHQLDSKHLWKPVSAMRLGSVGFRTRNADLVYFNGIASAEAMRHSAKNARRVLHVHELNVALRSLRPREDLHIIRSLPDRWIAASEATKQALVAEVGVSPDAIYVQYEFIDTTPFVEKAKEAAASDQRPEAFDRLGIPVDAVVVMGSGTLEWRKGPDLFVQVAAEASRSSSVPLHFVWVGGELDGPDWERLRSDLERTSLSNVHFVGTQTDPTPWFAGADVFLLTSREDPFPLVCLEHGAMGHPIATYRNGGVVELLEAAGSEAAFGIAPYLASSQLAEVVVGFAENRQLRQLAGDQLKERVLAEHDVRAAAPKLFAELNRIAQAS